MRKVREFASFVRTITTVTSEFVSIHLPQPYSYLSVHAPDAIYLKNREIDRLIKFGHLNAAIKLFDEMPLHDVVTYNLLISGCFRHGHPERALGLYSQMVLRGIRESASTFTSVLGTCSNTDFSKEGSQIHCRVVFLGFSLNLFIGTSLIDYYMRMGLDIVALKLFDELPQRNIAVWNLLLRRFCELGQFEKLLGSFSKMQLEGVEPNGLTLCYLLRGVGNERLLDEGRQLHSRAVKIGLVESNIFVPNALVDFYSDCRSLTEAKKAFECIPLEDVISWNSIVAVYADIGFLSESLELFSRMQFWGKRPSIRSLMAFLNLSSRTRNIQLGKQIQSCALKLGFGHESSHLQSALINMYGKCFDIESSVAVYESISVRTLECCNSLMTSLLHCGVIEDVIEMFGLMADEGIGLDEVTLSTTLKALSMSSPTDLTGCRLLHCCAIKSGLGFNSVVSCSLMDSYSRCGHVELSCKVFEEIHSPGVICFTSIINGYARNGMGKEGIEMLKTMIQKGWKPDKVTFLCALIGCNHSGLVEEGRFVFELMKTVCGIEPDWKHYSCMVDLLGRVGLLDEAEKLLLKVPEKVNGVIWSSMLRSCRVHRNETIGRKIAKSLVDLEAEDPAALLQASNFYSDIGDFETSKQLREVALTKKVIREIGHSLIEVKGHC
ncbi:pentatricopeptide repeat-containing protein At1g74600, chloroplastic [Cucurbita pepo subsp. pepo]|uniref:pentatricopeptide repeat-containing protein At1g74600, chloroplastic n=1 Tax=Cucurbita pepo subsp. pepo TaxID=3664 RepID=UPI000C9D7F38|nr:pentatricopeptide repeat-containing protein At1g74600, chloroplastic [Cucurbita pepo subsp. pepo]XP_023545643.1 pentatricopeptide repeat-containing protein At1g74600, chloroplastic [Cucurbita pepo subsp. pepo]XP_023545644.1 pentatricopeptide repeat-containing protein At1g74600, chloroplastic [Cucurbita pepo subsp. pepo]